MIFNDRVKENTSSVGTGSYQLSGAHTGFETFASSFPDGAETSYCVTDGSQYEVGHGTFTLGTLTLSRDLIVRSSNSNNPVNWTAGVKTIFCTLSSALVPTYSNSNPTATINPVFVGAEHINTSSGVIWVCVDNTVDNNIWKVSGMTESEMIQFIESAVPDVAIPLIIALA